MGFLDTIFIKNKLIKQLENRNNNNNETKNENENDDVQELNITVLNGGFQVDTQDTPQETLEIVHTAPTSINLMSKLFRYQKTPILAAPDTMYENEAWAPETKFVRLFRKGRVNAETPSSDLQ